MSLFQGIEHGKEHRKHYRSYLYRSGWFQSCENHNPNHQQCPWCRDNRLHANQKREQAAQNELEEYRKAI